MLLKHLLERNIKIKNDNFALLLDLFSISIAFSVLIDETDKVEKNELNRIFNINYFSYSGYLKANNEGTA